MSNGFSAECSKQCGFTFEHRSMVKRHGAMTETQELADTAHTVAQLNKTTPCEGTMVLVGTLAAA